jgi:hypothetical protein
MQIAASSDALSIKSIKNFGAPNSGLIRMKYPSLSRELLMIDDVIVVSTLTVFQSSRLIVSTDQGPAIAFVVKTLDY